MAIFRIFIIIYILIYISKTEGLSSTKDDIVENKIYENIKSYTNTLIGFLGYDKTKNIDNIHNIFKRKKDVSTCSDREEQIKPPTLIDLNILTEPIFLKKENTIFYIKENDISINNFLAYSFNVKSDMYYKIKFNVDICDSQNIYITNSKLIITDEKNNNFIYESTDNINNFVLDNNKFNINGKINICIIFYHSISDIKDIVNNNSTDLVINSTTVKDRLLCNSINFEVIECNYKKSNNSIIIFKTDEKTYPIYSDTLNILDNSIFF